MRDRHDRRGSTMESCPATPLAPASRSDGPDGPRVGPPSGAPHPGTAPLVETGHAGRRGAARDPGRRPGPRGHHAHAGARRRARPRIPADGRRDRRPGGRRDRAVLRRRGRRGSQHLQRARHRSRGGCSGAGSGRGTELLHDVVLRRVREGLARRGASDVPARADRGCGGGGHRRPLVPAGHAARASAPVLDHRRTARGRIVRRRRPTARRAGGRRSPQRRRQGRGVGRVRRADSPDRHRPHGERPGIVRAGTEGGDGRDSRAGRGVRAVVARGRSGRRDGSDRGGVPAR